jgi:hypothetical protein
MPAILALKDYDRLLPQKKSRPLTSSDLFRRGTQSVENSEGSRERTEQLA